MKKYTILSLLLALVFLGLMACGTSNPVCTPACESGKVCATISSENKCVFSCTSDDDCKKDKTGKDGLTCSTTTPKNCGA